MNEQEARNVGAALDRARVRIAELKAELAQARKERDAAMLNEWYGERTLDGASTTQADAKRYRDALEQIANRADTPHNIRWIASDALAGDK